MDIKFFIISLSMFFWIFPAVKQYKTDLFWYFLIYAYMDPINLILASFHTQTSEYFYMFFDFFLMLSVIWVYRSRKSARLLIAVILISLLIKLLFPKSATIYPSLFIHLITTYFFTIRTFLFVANTGKVNIFHLFLLLEEVSIILKYLAVVIDIKTSTGYFYATGAFQILIAIFFTLYREDNKKLHIDLRTTLG